MLHIIADANIPFVRSAFAHLGEVQMIPTGAIRHQAIADADVLLIRSETRVDRSLLQGTRVQFVGSATIGTDHVDLDYLRQKGIGFANAPGSNANAVAEYVMAALFWVAERDGFSLKGKTLGVVGVGNIGSRVVRMASAIGMHVLQNDPPLARAALARAALARATDEPRFVSLDDLMEADVVTLHVPLTKSGPDATYHLFGGDRLAKMKRGSLLINTARGAVVDTVALKDALADGVLAGAVLDVWENEPAIDEDLLERTTLATPHIAGYSLDGKVNATLAVYQAVCRHFGQPASWEPGAVLPQPATARIRLQKEDVDGESSIRTVIRQCYDIEQDDRRFRTLLTLPKEQRRDYFIRFRNEYPLRREFFSTTIELSNDRHQLRQTLESLGFRVKIC